jgi:DNA-binding NarL/FixJ family response regulator
MGIDFAGDCSALAAVIDRLAAAVFLLDGGGRVVYVNIAGRAALDRGNLLRAPNGTLTADDPETDRTLREAFAAVGRVAGDISAQAIAVALTDTDGERYVGYALPLASKARPNDGLTTAATALFVRKAGLDLPSPIESLARLYKLTTSESTVLQAVVDLGSVPAAAKALGLSQATVKTHVHHVFQKTGTKRQIDLAKLVAGAASPFTE